MANGEISFKRNQAAPKSLREGRVNRAQEQNIVVIARAPGKIILSGEHSVVYGRPALALAINRFAETTITCQPGYGIWFEFPNDKLKHITTMRGLQELKTLIAKRYRKFTVGKYQIKDVIHSPLELIQYAFI